MALMLVPSGREPVTGPNTKEGIMVVNSKPSFLLNSQPFFSATVYISTSSIRLALAFKYNHASTGCQHIVNCFVVFSFVILLLCKVTQKARHTHVTQGIYTNPQYICTCTRYNCMCLRYSYTNKTCPGPGTLPYYTCIHPPCLALSLCSSPLLCTACHCLGQTSSSVQLQVIEQLSACLLVKASWTLEQQQQKPA